MEQIVNALVAIVLGVSGMLAYYFGANLLIDRIFADDPPSFSVADFLALLSAVVLLIAFLVMPWATELRTTELSPEGETFTYTGSELLSLDTGEDSEAEAMNTPQFGLFLIPIAALLGMAFALRGLFYAEHRGTSAAVTMAASLVALVYFFFYFIRSGQADVLVEAEAGFYVAIFAMVGLFLQVVVTRPLYTPPPSEMVMKVNTTVRQQVRPWLFVTPALLALGLYLVYPAINTFLLSFFDRHGEEFVGLANYEWGFTNATMVQAFGNNILWLILAPAASTAIGLLVAILADRVRWESFAKALIFMPMAISFVGASVVWRFVYAFRPPGEAQIGLLNAVVTTLGGEPVGWYIQQPGNNLALIIILIWIQAGFATVLLSAALKGVPEETLEAARIDGANEVSIFFRIIIPQIMTTITVVMTTIIIVVLKIFDIVFVMTSGQFGTEVLANRMYREMFRNFQFGRGSMIAVILMVAVLPIMYINIRRFNAEEAAR